MLSAGVLTIPLSGQIQQMKQEHWGNKCLFAIL